MKFNLKNKIIIITGASSGIGKELAFQCARKGAKVVLAARRMAALLEIEDKIIKDGGQALAVGADVSRRFDVENCVRKTLQKFGRLDVVINNAGISHADLEALELLEADVKATMDTNFMAAVYSVWAAVPAMEKTGSGQLVFVSSIVGKRGIPRSSIYCASKFALLGFAESIRLELKKKNIHVLSVCPPGVDTPFFEVNKRSSKRSFRLHPASKIAAMIIEAMEKQKREVTLTVDAKILHVLNMIFPSLLDWLISRKKGSSS